MTPSQRFNRLKTEVDWRPVLITACSHYGLDLDVAKARLEAFLQWFSLIPDTDKKLQMLPSVDVIWHSFILNTAIYTEVCMTYVGHYVHHDPMDPERAEVEKEGYARDTLGLLAEHFGDAISPALLDLEHTLTCCIGCGSSVEKEAHIAA